jgi:hypothetical protein
MSKTFEYAMKTKAAAALAPALTMAVLTMAVFTMAMPAVAQTPVYRPPRTADGKPDLNGIWQALNEANYDIEAHVARPAMAVRPGPYGPVPAAAVLAFGAAGAVPPGLGVVEGGEIPYKPEALAKKQENQAHWLEADPEIKCYLPGVPRANYMPYPFQILQSASAFVMVYEYAGAVRNVFLKDPGPPPVDSWMGQSVGHWDKDTFVVDVKGISDQTWFDRAGNFHSEALHVVERYTRTSPDVISYEATIEDPNVFTRPWKMSMPLYRRQEKNAMLLDFKCPEFVEELIYGQWRKKPLSK